MDNRRTRIIKLTGLPEIIRTSKGQERVIDARPAPRVPPRNTRQRKTIPTASTTAATTTITTTTNATTMTTSPIRRKSISPLNIHRRPVSPPPVAAHRRKSMSPAPVGMSPTPPPCQHLVEEVTRLGEQVSILTKQLSQLLEISRHSEPPMSIPRHQPSPAPSSSRSRRSHHSYDLHHSHRANNNTNTNNNTHHRHHQLNSQHYHSRPDSRQSDPVKPTYAPSIRGDEMLADVSMASRDYLRRNNMLNI